VSLGGTLKLDVEQSKYALTNLANQLNMGALETARGILALANEHMIQALRVISVQRGLDPKDFALMSFGGAGGLHVCALAQALRMTRAVVPAYAGVLSALGLAWAQPQREKIQALPAGINEESLETIARTLTQQGFSELLNEGCPQQALMKNIYVDVRYQGQGFSLSIAWQGSLVALETAFHEAHEQQYGHRLKLPVDWVNVRVRCSAVIERVALPAAPKLEGGPLDHVSVDQVNEPVPVYERAQLGAGQRVSGPALIVEAVATTWLAPGWQAQVHPQGHLILER
jgi:N-methylhydantoinase A